MELPSMQTPNDLSKSLTVLKQNSTWPVTWALRLTGWTTYVRTP